MAPRPEPPRDPDLPALLDWIKDDLLQTDQEGLALRLHVDQGTVSKWKQRRREPGRANREAIAALAGLDVVYVASAIARTEWIPEETKGQLARKLQIATAILGEHGLEGLYQRAVGAFDEVAPDAARRQGLASDDSRRAGNARRGGGGGS